jgi:superfamily II DNA or RNA helicase
MKRFNAHVHEYYMPIPEPRSLRRRREHPPRRVLISSGTLVVVPRNLVQQWRSEIRKHVQEGDDGLKVLVMDDGSRPLPDLEDLVRYDVVLFSKPRFEKEATDGVEVVIGQTPRTMHDDSYVKEVYRSPLRDVHWLRIIIDEGHEFASSSSNAVYVAEKLVTAERRWVVSGTPAKDLVYSVEVDLASTIEGSSDGRSPSRSQSSSTDHLDRRKEFNPAVDTGSSSAAKSIGLLVQRFLRTRPWALDDSVESRSPLWEDYIYRHEHFRNRTFTGFSSCLRKTLASMVVKTQPEDVERDIVLPPLVHTVVPLQGSFYDKLTANLFILVLTGNAVTSERSDVDYLFNDSRRSAQARKQLVTNLRQSNFFWTGFSVSDVQSAIGHATEYLKKDPALVKCPEDDRQKLLSCVDFAQRLMGSETWTALSNYHELGLFVRDWPAEAGRTWALTESGTDPMLIGVSLLSQSQAKVNERLGMDEPLQGLKEAGELAMRQLHDSYLESLKASSGASRMGVPTSGIKVEQSAKRPIAGTSPKKPKRKSDVGHGTEETPPKKRRSSKNAAISLDSSVEPKPIVQELPFDSPLGKTSVVGTVSAKLSYLLDRISRLYLDEKILVFYDGNNAAWYLSQCLDLLHIKHLIYAKDLNNFRRSKYIVAFDTDDSIRVLLMDVNCGAYGLNVNKASRVFFINPVCNPRTEAQAIKRAHRIGQTRPVYVETLVISDTIEAAILERSSQMTETEHKRIEASQLSDDSGIAQIIQNAGLIPVDMEGTERSQMAPLDKPLQVFGRPGWHDTKIHGIDQDFFSEPGARKPSAKKRAVESPAPVEPTSTPNAPMSGRQLMYTPKRHLFAAPPRSDAVPITDALPSVFGGNPPTSAHRRPNDMYDASPVRPHVFREPSTESTPTESPDDQPMQDLGIRTIAPTGTGPWVARSPSMVLLDDKQLDGKFENWSVKNRPREEKKKVTWSLESRDSTKPAERSLFGWGRDARM